MPRAIAIREKGNKKPEGAGQERDNLRQISPQHLPEGEIGAFDWPDSDAHDDLPVGPSQWCEFGDDAIKDPDPDRSEADQRLGLRGRDLCGRRHGPVNNRAHVEVGMRYQIEHQLDRHGIDQVGDGPFDHIGGTIREITHETRRHVREHVDTGKTSSTG